MNYREVLGVPGDADQKAIKKAYFKLVRQYSPEKDPERFQQIREAYESLMADEGKGKGDGIKLEFPVDPMADWMREQLTAQMKAHDYKGAMKTAEDGLMHYGEVEGFLYFLAVCQRRLGNTGKAVKNFERLAKLYPDKDIYKKELAIAYYERGYGKKAYEAFGKAYKEGCGDYDFLNMYAMCCRDRGKTEQCLMILKEATQILEKSPRDHIVELLDNQGGILFMGASGEDGQFAQAVKGFGDFLEKNRFYVKEYEDDIWQILMGLMPQCAKSSRVPGIEELLHRAEEIAAPQKGKGGRDFKEKWDYLKKELEYWHMEGDNRLSEVMKEAYEAFVTGSEDSSLTRFMQRDIQLCILEEWPGIKKEFEVVRKEYPLFWEDLKDFAYTLEHSGDLERLRQQYQKDYDRREKFISGGHYYMRYPDRRAAQEKVQWDGGDGTYTRSQPKIGRNDPCPCGSGKKYKNCCGRK